MVLLRAFNNAEEFMQTIKERGGRCVCRLKKDNSVIMSPHIPLMLGKTAIDTLVSKEQWGKMFEDIEFVDGQEFGIKEGV